MIKLSERLETMAGHVRQGDVAADIGTDHGKLPVWLYEKGICPAVILTDISGASLEKARETAGAAQFGRAVSFRVGDGLKPLKRGEADTVIIAGMGGKLIRQILAEDPQHTAGFKRLILQPRTASGPLRKWLLENGYRIAAEDIVREGKFLPEIITADAPGEAESGGPSGEPGGAYDGELGSQHNGEHIGHRGSAGSKDLAAADRHWLAELPEDDIRLRVPPWIMKAGGHPAEFVRLRLKQERSILDSMKRAGMRNLKAEQRAILAIGYLEELLQKEGHRP